MKPDFALSLSFEGITFLCRSDGGWHNLGDVPLQHADLTGALEALRTRGEALLQADETALCKLIIPNDQIKYIYVDATDEDPDLSITNALSTATPYAVEDLEFDYVEDADGFQVAAVARETLEEAESFAVEHGFSPVSFVAVPSDSEFDGEPFFGKTKAADDLLPDGDAITPEEQPVVATSHGDQPVFSPSQDPAPEPAETVQAEEPPAVTPSFSSRRNLTPTVNDAGIPPALGGATRDAEMGQPADIAVAADVAATSAVSQQENRFDPTVLAAGLKPRPAASGKERDRGIARSKDVVPPVRTDDRSATPTAAPAMAMGTVPQPAEQARSRPLVVILLALLILFMAGVAAWASLFNEDGIAGLFKRSDVAQIPLETVEAAPIVEAETVLASADPAITTDGLIDTAEIEADDINEGMLHYDPVMEAAPPQTGGVSFYAATGIWDRAPAQPMAPATGTSEGIYLGSFEVEQQTHDAIALPEFASLAPDAMIAKQNDPVQAGVTFDLDERGLVVATAEGAISPEGILVFSGKPSVLPAAWPERAVAPEETAPTEPSPEQLQLASVRPQIRPTDLIEQNERANLGGSTRSELAQYRPRLRPERALPQQDESIEAVVAAIDADDAASATQQAVLASLRPKARPSGFEKTVEKTQERVAAVAVPDSSVVTPSIPTTASVARSATENNVINLRKVNLIGVYGTANDRRALVRLASGRYKKVKVGDRIDGGQVAAIGDDELRYVKGNRSVVLTMPKG